MKLDYDMQQTDDYVDIYVYYVVGDRSWELHLYRDMETLYISNPVYQYSPNSRTSFEEVTRLPKRVQRYFDDVTDQAKTLLILGSN